MKILIAPLNWGLGHATRCVPLIERYRKEGHEVILGGDGESLLWLKRRFPTLRLEPLASLNVRYSATRSQFLVLLCQLPQFVRFVREDRHRLAELQAKYHFDLVIADNRFGLSLPHAPSAAQGVRDDSPMTVYLTHQLQIRLPRFWRWAEPLARKVHASFYSRFDEVWVPDEEDLAKSLAGWLSHPRIRPQNVRYMGPLSRFSSLDNQEPVAPLEKGSEGVFPIVALLSGPEPQRSLFEQFVIRRYEGCGERVLIVRGKISGPQTATTHLNITLVPRLEDDPLCQALLNCRKIIARSGYSTIMDLSALGLLHKAELIPTPGQSEQEYLAAYLKR